MKPICENCHFYMEGHEGDYGSGPFFVECTHPIMSHYKRPRISITDLPYFPFSPAPGCFEPNPWFDLPERLFKVELKGEYPESDEEMYDHIYSLEWSGDAIDLVER